jgi:hypothetical protein
MLVGIRLKEGFMPAPNTVPVSVRALVQRINRKLAQAGQALRTTRGNRWRSNLGHYYVLNLELNYIARTRVDLEALGRELGVLSPWESVVRDEGAAPQADADEKKQRSKRPGKVS